MIRLLFTVEGQTEETFVRDVLAPALSRRLVFASARCVATGRRGRKVFRGGSPGYPKLREDVLRWMKEDRRPEAWFTTMVDLFALATDFPGYDEARRMQGVLARVEHLEECWKRDMNHPRFIPHIQPHEFEALLFADPTKLVQAFPGEQEAISKLAAVASQFSSPEEIDDGADTAPSKRIAAVLPAYQQRKASVGPLVAQAIGLERMRRECTHFGRWINRLESLGLQA
jgi:hypothetical protein